MIFGSFLLRAAFIEPKFEYGMSMFGIDDTLLQQPGLHFADGALPFCTTPGIELGIPSSQGHESLVCVSTLFILIVGPELIVVVIIIHVDDFHIIVDMVYGFQN